MEENLKIYNELRVVPKEAQKKITGGRLSGMTDIKPMWRIEKLTEVFGMCGIGWKASIKNKEIIDGANGEKIAIVDIELYVKVNGEWSEPIEGTGGSSFIAKEKSGLYTSDECFKMAYTDAISVACKSLGMGADVYWGDSKYSTQEKKDATKKTTTQEKKDATKKTTTKEVVKESKNKTELMIQESQKKLINELYTTEEIMPLLNYVGKTKVEELTLIEASSLIKRKNNK